MNEAHADIVADFHSGPGGSCWKDAGAGGRGWDALGHVEGVSAEEVDDDAIKVDVDLVGVVLRVRRVEKTQRAQLRKPLPPSRYRGVYGFGVEADRPVVQPVPSGSDVGVLGAWKRRIVE